MHAAASSYSPLSAIAIAEGVKMVLAATMFTASVASDLRSQSGNAGSGSYARVSTVASPSASPTAAHTTKVDVPLQSRNLVPSDEEAEVLAASDNELEEDEAMNAELEMSFSE
jgi:hypothetical protein